MIIILAVFLILSAAIFGGEVMVENGNSQYQHCQQVKWDDPNWPDCDQYLK